jgi:mxaJ protein
VAFSLLGNEPNPPARIMDAVASGQIDIAVVWGPLAGYFAGQSQFTLQVKPISETAALGVPLAFDISAAVRKSDEELRREVDQALGSECKVIGRILEGYSIPLAAGSKSGCGPQ